MHDREKSDRLGVPANPLNKPGRPGAEVGEGRSLPEGNTASELKSVKTEMRRRMHHPIAEQGHWLTRVLQGHYNYYAVPDNSEALHGFRRRLIRLWLQALRRRSQKDRLTWKRMLDLDARWLPEPRILHPGPTDALTPKPKGRAQCAKRARWDLCGGPPATAVPTAIRPDRRRATSAATARKRPAVDLFPNAQCGHRRVPDRSTRLVLEVEQPESRVYYDV
jgi:hypothetical protein